MAVRVVIAEDEAIIRLDLKETLEEEGYEVVGETGRGDEAVELVRSLSPAVLVYGAGRRAKALLDLRRRADTRGFKIIGFMTTAGDTVSAPADRLVLRPDDLYRWSIENDIDEIVVAMDDRRQGFPMHELLECRMSGIEVLELPSFLERETGKVRLDVLNPSWIIFGDGFRASPTQQVLARGLDLVANRLRSVE